ncbi:unnamed protein product, partial [Mesorhabditis spiculigera]
MVRAAGLVLALKKPAEEAKFLLLQASKAPFHWSPPKGHIDEGEQDLDAAIRETEEESGYRRSQFKVHEDTRHEITYKITQSVAHPEDVGKTKTAIYWLAVLSTNSEAVVSEEHTNAKWVSVEEAKSLNDLPGMAELWDRYAAILGTQ